MVRTFTTTTEQAGARQWMAAWVTLPLEQRLAIIRFCLRSDTDVAELALAAVRV